MGLGFSDQFVNFSLTLILVIKLVVGNTFIINDQTTWSLNAGFGQQLYCGRPNENY